MVDKPGWEAGLLIDGWDYGWPWTYRTVASKSDVFSYDGFDRFDWSALAANIAVGLFGSALMAWIAERSLRYIVRGIALVLRSKARRGVQCDGW